MGTDRNSTHTVVVRTENRGIRVLIGAAVLYLWVRWWWTGTLLATVASAVPGDVQDGQFGSVTGTLLPIAVDLLGFIGSIIISALGLGWAAIWDVISGVLETLGIYRKQEAATQAAVDAATETATISAASDAGASVGFAEPVRQIAKVKRRVDIDKVAAALQSQDTELDDLDKLIGDLGTQLQGLSEYVDKANEATRGELAGILERLTTFDRRLELAATRDLEFMRGEVVKSFNTRYLPIESKVEQLANRLDGQRSMFDEASKSFDQIIERLETIEQSAVKKPPTRKATRQAPAKR